MILDHCFSTAKPFESNSYILTNIIEKLKKSNIAKFRFYFMDWLYAFHEIMYYNINYSKNSFEGSREVNMKKVVIMVYISIFIASVFFCDKIEKGIFEVENIDVYYERIENNSEETCFILMHGFGASTFSFRDIVLPLSDYGEVIAFDRPGFGLTERITDMDFESPVDKNPYSREFQRIVIDNLINSFAENKKIVLMGHSAGCSVAIDYTLNHPGKIGALILIAPSLKYRKNGSFAMDLFVKLAENGLTIFTRNIMLSQLETVLENSWYDRDKLTEEIIQGYKIPLSSENWERALVNFTLSQTDFDFTAEIGSIKVPVLIIHGLQDSIIPLKENAETYELFSDHWLVTFDRCGHLPHEECAWEFMRIVSLFVENRIYR